MNLNLLDFLLIAAYFLGLLATMQSEGEQCLA